MSKNGKSLAVPSQLKPFDSDDKQFLRVVIETPKGSRNKFALDPDERIFELKKVLPAGMTFPLRFLGTQRENLSFDLAILRYGIPCI
jgi:inorganic pyrophosphatase